MNKLNVRKSSKVRQVQPEIAEKIKEIGKVFNESVVGATQELYLPLHKSIDRRGITVHKDISYGPNERHLLDIHVPEHSSGSMASVIFFHGGGFVRGHKNVAGEMMYGNISNYFARNGVIGINATYRLAPEHKWPSGAQDVGRALKWVRESIVGYGGEPAKLIAMGQSAGATHVATYAFRSDIHGSDDPSCAGFILMSGVYGIKKENITDNQRAYYSDDASKYDDMAVLGKIDRGNHPIFISIAELDPTMFEQSGIALINELANNHQNVPRFKQLLGHNHISQVASINTEDETVGADLMDFINSYV